MTDIPDHVHDRMNRTEKRLDGHEQRINQLERDATGMVEWRNSTSETLKGIQGDTKWIVRLIIASVLGGVLAMLYNGGIN